MPTPTATASPAERWAWPRHRWWWTIAGVFALQVGLILGLGQRGPVRPRPAGPVVSLRLAGGIRPELLALDDPTLLALPHLTGYSGPAWIRVPPFTNRPPDWSEEPRTLPLGLDQLKALPARPPRGNPLAPSPVLPEVEPALALSEPPPLALTPDQSRLRIEGDLAQCRLLTTFDLPSWPYPEVLGTNCVELVVNGEGRPIAWTLLSKSGDPKADEFALAQARAARFEVPGGAGQPGAPAIAALLRAVRGCLLFAWHTAPLPPTNAPPGPKP
jgi:hypothetical protein